jgi:TonB family protein
MILHPLPGSARLDSATFTSKEMKFGTTKLRCFPEALKMALDVRNAIRSPRSFIYCFQGSEPALRLLGDSFGGSTAFNGIIRIHDHDVGRQIRGTDAKGRLRLSIDVEQADPNLGVDEASLDPPADAKIMSQLKTDFPTGVVSGCMVSGDQPAFPLSAAALGKSGLIVLRGIISREGTVSNLRIVTGPKPLQQAVLDAVKTWRYSPFMLAGDPVEVDTKIEVPYYLGPLVVFNQ